jgi:hypothetical protein
MIVLLVMLKSELLAVFLAMLFMAALEVLLAVLSSKLSQLFTIYVRQKLPPSKFSSTIHNLLPNSFNVIQFIWLKYYK